MVVVGFGLIQAAAVCNTIIQSLVPDDKRARVMGYYTMAFFGAAPFGSLMAGALGAAHRRSPHGHADGRMLHRGRRLVHLAAAEDQARDAAAYREKELSAQREAELARARAAALQANASIANPKMSNAAPHQRLMSIPSER